jgi:hypothetical protein
VAQWTRVLKRREQPQLVAVVLSERHAAVEPQTVDLRKRGHSGTIGAVLAALRIRCASHPVQPNKPRQAARGGSSEVKSESPSEKDGRPTVKFSGRQSPTGPRP